MRLNQFLAKYLGLARRQADTLISNNEVLVNGTVAVIGQKIDPEADTVEYQNKPIQTQSVNNQYLAFYKPIFSMCSRFDPQRRKTIYDFLPKHYHHLKSAGRLDYMSEGLLILSNDGPFLNSISHPSNDKVKKYLVGVNQAITTAQIAEALSGKMVIDDYQLRPVIITPIKDLSKWSFLKLNGSNQWYEFELKEGRNNQIRKMCDYFRTKVVRLIRSQHGEFHLTPELYQTKYQEVSITQE